MTDKEPFVMRFDVATIKHLGLQMYSTLPSVIGELVANCWDANATKVDIAIPISPIDDNSEITITDNGIGMSDADIRKKYITVGRNRREYEKSDETGKPLKRKVMGRKGIGKFSSFGIATEIEIESRKDGQTSRFKMNYDEMLARGIDREFSFPVLEPTGNVSRGTRVTLRYINKFRNRRIDLGPLKRRLARRFSVIGASNKFEVFINDQAISVEDRDLKRLAAKDADGNPYLWEFTDEEIKEETGWMVNGWIGALDRTTPAIDGVDRGIALMARGKLVQEPFVFEATVGQQFALSYLIGELHVEFVDEVEDTIGTSRNVLVWDSDANTALKEWGQKNLNIVAREWAERRKSDNESRLENNKLYQQFRHDAERTGSDRSFAIADRLVRQSIGENPTAGIEELEPVIQTAITFLEFDAFRELVEDLLQAGVDDPIKILNLFREWEIIEAKEMSRVTEGRISTIRKFQDLIEGNAMEVPVLHNFLKEFPWVIDPRWTLVADEIYYTELLREHFPESDYIPESNRRIDFLCVRESHNLVVVEIKRPSLRASMTELGQIEGYVSFLRHQVRTSTDPDLRYENVTGYLICGDVVDTYQATEKVRNLSSAQIYVRKYGELLSLVEDIHRQFLNRYNELYEAKERALFSD